MKENKVKSLLINTVHDSIVVDVHPDEFKLMTSILDKATAGVTDYLYDVYNIEFNVPLDTELKMGDNWLDMDEVNLKKERIVL